MAANPARNDSERDYYTALGVPEDAADDEINRAYRRLARMHHPDVDADNPHATEDFERLTAAREVLGDPVARAAYDKLRARNSTTPARRTSAPPRPPRRSMPEPAIRPGPVTWIPDTRRWRSS